MTWASDNAMVARFLDAKDNSPAYNCPERGTVRVVVPARRGELLEERVLFTGPESTLSWAKRHYAKVAPRSRRSRLDPFDDFVNRRVLRQAGLLACSPFGPGTRR